MPVRALPATRFIALPVALFAVLAAFAPPLGCGDALDQEEAARRCETIRTRESACFGSATMQSCVDCHTECGDDCGRLGSCPLEFACPD
jgi:hypothetical protein